MLECICEQKKHLISNYNIYIDIATLGTKPQEIQFFNQGSHATERKKHRIPLCCQIHRCLRLHFSLVSTTTSICNTKFCGSVNGKVELFGATACMPWPAAKIRTTMGDANQWVTGTIQQGNDGYKLIIQLQHNICIDIFLQLPHKKQCVQI